MATAARFPTNSHPDYKQQTDCNKNAQCLVEHRDGAFCGEFVKLKPSTEMEGFFDMSNALSHFKSKGKHLGSAAYERANEKVQQKTRAIMATKQMTIGESMNEHGKEQPVRK